MKSMKQQLKMIYEETNHNRIAELNIDCEGINYKRIFLPRERLIILGGGHLAQPVCTIASMLGFSIYIVDDRADYANKERFPEADGIICGDFSSAIEDLHISSRDYVVVMTRAHHYDNDCLKKILSGTEPFYLGMLGSRRRTKILLDNLVTEGYDRERIHRIHTPIGLDIGAISIQEIAVSINAELIKYRRQSFGKDSKKNILQEETFSSKILGEIIDKKLSQVMCIVCDTEGSTPVKSGAFMSVDSEKNILGTIGGGYAEYMAFQEACSMLDSEDNRFVNVKKDNRCITVNMNNDQAEKEGMMCGGRMKVLLIPM